MLFTGPISRLENFEESEWNYPDVLRRLVLGLGLLTAGTFCGRYVLTERMIREGATCSQHWISIIANSFDLYFNFSGWSHLVIGLGLLVGFKLPENFNYPYLSTSVSEFWRRWHMSLSYWIRDYLYIPLGGNRKGLARKCANLLIAMGLCGLWHGLELHYLAWGLFHGVLLTGESIFAARNWQPVRRLLPGAHQPVKIATTFILVTFAWLLFRYSMPIVPLCVRGLWPW
jgi:alginate O-acetyltransferase complex protein AlgI